MKCIKASALGLAFAAAAWANPSPAGIPAALQPAAGESLATTVNAAGVQIYECRATGATPTGHAWTFVAPEAELFDAKGQGIGRHGAGPYWQADDGSRVVGKVKARAEAPAAGTIPWLLLITESTGPQGAFSKVTSIQRIDTVGGAVPTTACTRQAAGTLARIHYTAVYRLFSNQKD
ncbi:MAG: DUF3455 domain-containing protein [Reyranella sp.]|nr:DUF3455 domain-containing protein [Reyranella sp.]